MTGQGVQPERCMSGILRVTKVVWRKGASVMIYYIQIEGDGKAYKFKSAWEDREDGRSPNLDYAAQDGAKYMMMKFGINMRCRNSTVLLYNANKELLGRWRILPMELMWFDSRKLREEER